MKREPKKTALLISSAWLFTIAIAFWLGSLWARSRGGDSLSVVGEQDLEKAQETIERIVVIRKFSGETPKLDPAESFPPQVQLALRRALREADPHRRGYAVDVILSGQSCLQELVGKVRQAPGSNDRRSRRFKTFSPA